MRSENNTSSNFNIEDAVDIIKEIVGVICDISQERRFIFDNREALRIKNFIDISNRLEMTKERYKFAIEIFFLIFDIAERVASPPPPSRKNKSLRMQACEYCLRYIQQDSNECAKCHALTHYTNCIPVYAIMQKAGEKGIDWGIDWLLDQFTERDKARVKGEFYARRSI